MQLSFSNAMSPHLRARLETLRKKFIAGIPKRLSDMDAAPSLTARLQVLHQLTGAALSYEAHALGALAKSTEAELEAGADVDWPTCRAALHAEYVKLEAGEG
ncbi:MAG: hypothetical protein ACKVOT_03945 [Polaromonas sp.]